MPRILLIGGGVGGLATAACLRARGIDSVIYERAPALVEVGAAIGVWPNATRVLRRLGRGVLDRLLETAHIADAGALRATDGRILKQMIDLRMDCPSVFTHRADLHAALLSVIPPDTIHLDHACTAIERGDAGKVRARFADGSASDWADGLVGADGIRSVVREQLLHDGPPVYRGYIAWRGVADFDTGAKEVVGETWGRGRRFGFIPLGKGRVGWWATINLPAGDARAMRETGAAYRGIWKREVLTHFKGWHEPIEKLVAATPDDAFLCTEIADRPSRTDRWGEGTVTLLGDAAHPTTPNLGQGACMAIEDAAVLAHALAAIPSIETAFRVYEQTRMPRTSFIVRESLKFGRIGQWHGTISCAVRDVLMRLAPQSALAKQFQTLWIYDAWDAALSMPA